MCTIEIDAAYAAPIVVEAFDVESYFDYILIDNAEYYTGVSGPSGVTPSSTIVWTSDFTVTRSGWRFCMPEATPAPPPTPASTSMWGTISGPCTLEGACVESPNYPARYSNNQMCTIEINAAHAAPIVVEYFNTESYFDYLLVDGWKYFSGRRRRPHGFTPYESILWTSDFTVTRKGWRMCEPDRRLLEEAPGPDEPSMALAAAGIAPSASGQPVLI